MTRMLAEAAFQIVLFAADIAVGHSFESAIGRGFGFGGGFAIILLLNWSKLFDRIWPRPETTSDR